MVDEFASGICAAALTMVAILSLTRVSHTTQRKGKLNVCVHRAGASIVVNAF